jgi:hypothetical protein
VAFPHRKPQRIRPTRFLSWRDIGSKLKIFGRDYPSSTIRVALPEAAHVTLTVYNILGQRIRMLLDKKLNAGHHNVRFDANGLASGAYFYDVRGGSYVSTRKMLLMG